MTVITFQGSIAAESVNGTLSTDYADIYHQGHLCTFVRVQGKRILGIYKGTKKYWERTNGAYFGDIKRQWTLSTLGLQGVSTVDDMSSTSNYGDINRQWISGGLRLQGLVTVNDMDSYVAYGDINRTWCVSTTVLKGIATVDDMDTNVVYGDIKRQWTTTQIRGDNMQTKKRKGCGKQCLLIVLLNY